MGYTPLLIRKALSAYQKECTFCQNADLDNEEQQMLKVIKRDGIYSVLNSNGEFDNHPKRETIKSWFEFCNEKTNSHFPFDFLYMAGRPKSNAVADYDYFDNQTLLFQLSEESSGIVISDVAIYEFYYSEGWFSIDDEVRNVVHYRDVDHVVCENSGIYQRLYFYNKNGEEVGVIGSVHYTIAQQLVQVLNKICQLPENTWSDELNDIENAKKSAMAYVWEKSFYLSHYLLGLVLSNELEERFKDDSESDEVRKLKVLIEKEYKKAITLCDPKENGDVISSSKAMLAEMEYMFNNLDQARKYLIEGLDGCKDDELEENMTLLLEDIDERLKVNWDNFTTLDYKERKFIMPTKCNIVGVNPDNITVFRMSNVPKCVEFTFGHPIANQLYIAHPFKTSLYVPYEKSEELFFSDKFYELKYLLECLGAEEITITSIKGKDVSELKDNNNNTSVGVDKKAFSANVDVNTHNETKSRTIQNSQHSLTVRLSSMHKPFVPEGLLWYKEMPQWQRLVQSRLNNNLLEYSELISTEETKFTSFTEMSEVQIEAKMLWSKVNVEVDSCMKNQFKESTETEWRVDVRFRPLQEFESEETETVADNGQSGLTEEEMKYAEEVMFFLEDDGIIDTDERRHLERKRIKLGISEEQAAKIESNMSLSALSEDEQEYYDAVKEELMDGVIPDSSRRLLERYRNRMGISAERAREIEMMLTK